MIATQSGAVVSRFVLARLMRANVAANIGEKQTAAVLRASLADHFFVRSYKPREKHEEGY